jgi:cell division protein FtsB
MGYGVTSKSKHRRQGLTLSLSLLLIYFLFHLFFSERSIPTMITLSKDQAELEITLVDTLKQRDTLLKTATGLRPETLDVDLIEEYTIQMLGHHNQASMVIMDES